MVPSTDPSFKRWLDRKDLSINDFNAWIKNSVDPVPFCPWKEDIYAGTVIDMVKELFEKYCNLCYCANNCKLKSVSPLCCSAPSTLFISFF